MASIVAIKLNDCVITSSPGLTSKDLSAIFIAAVPEDTARQYLELKKIVLNLKRGNILIIYG